MQITALTKLVLIKIANKDSKYPLKLRVTYGRQQKFYPCNQFLTEDEFDQIFHTPKMKKEQKEIRDTANAIETKAINIIKAMQTFDFDVFKKIFYEIKNDQGDVFALCCRYHDELIAKNRIGTAVMYKTLENSLKQYQSSISFAQITSTFLKGYEEWLMRKNEKGKIKSLTTVGIYMRHLRSVYNRAIFEKLAEKENYPFGRNKYVPPTGNNIKKALTDVEIGKLYNYPTLDTGWERKAKDFWFFSYFCNGMNIIDILLLKFQDIYDGEIHYKRAKTAGTSRGKNIPLIAVSMLVEAQSVITTWGNPYKVPTDYIFPALSHELSAKGVKQKVAQFTKNINKYINRIAKDVGIEKHVTTYVARHSFATVLKKSGATDEAISETLGHQLVSTTKSYLGSFESETRRKNAQALVAFNKVQLTDQ